jgi:hypothetical protein
LGRALRRARLRRDRHLPRRDDAGAAQGRRSLHPIELDPALHERARTVFAGIGGIELLLGDSGALIRQVLERLDEPALFWLDAHYPGAGTGRGAEDSPILHELAAILGHKVREHIVIIDDARDFTGSGGYPTIRDLARFVESRGYWIRIRDDLIRIYARPDL